MKRFWLTAPLALGLALMVAPGALAAGGPVPPVQGSYIGVPGSPYRYGSFGSGGVTIIRQRQAGASAAVSVLRVPGHYGIPAVDPGGQMTGLSADGGTLILAAIPRSYPPPSTRLLVLGTAPAAIRARIALPGWLTVDAISPDGRWLYLIHYPSSDISRYEVLAYNVPAHRLLAEPVVDPHDRGEAMTGFPIDRVMSASGRWAYTLYFRPSGEPFVHALDTSKQRAVCVDLPSLSGGDVSNGRLGLGPGGTSLRIYVDGSPQAAIDTRTFKVSAAGAPSLSSPAQPASPAGPAPPARPATHSQTSQRSDGGVPWGIVVLVIAVLAGVATGVAKIRRRRRHGREPDVITVIDLPPHRTPDDEELPVA